MFRGDWELAMARAVIDSGFRERLLADPAGTLNDYGLAAHERRLVSIFSGTSSLGELATCFLQLAATLWSEPEPAGYAVLTSPRFPRSVPSPLRKAALPTQGRVAGSSETSGGSRWHCLSPDSTGEPLSWHKPSCRHGRIPLSATVRQRARRGRHNRACLYKAANRVTLSCSADSKRTTRPTALGLACPLSSARHQRGARAGRLRIIPS